MSSFRKQTSSQYRPTQRVQESAIAVQEMPSSSLEQSNADLLILSQSLLKSARITERMTTHLGDLEDRLARLEKDLITPLDRKTGRLTRVSQNLERTLRSIEGLLGHHDLVDRERGLIDAGPNPDDLQPYYASIDKLLSASQALTRTDSKGQGATLTAMNALIKSAASQLIQLFTRWTKETSVPLDAGSLFDQGKPFPSLAPSFSQRGLSLFHYLRQLPIFGPSLLKDLERAYATVRASYMESSIKETAKAVLVDALAAGNEGDRRGLGRLMDVLIAMAQSEHSLLISLFSTSPATLRRDIYSAILPPSLNILFTTGQQLNTLVKQELTSLVSIAFLSYAELTERAPEFEEWIRVKGSRKENELGELQHAFRGSCLRSLPEFISDAQAWGNRTPTAAEMTAVGVTSLTTNVVNFMRHLAENPSTVESFLNVLGAGNWGDVATARALPTMEFGDTPSLLSRYLNDVLAALLVSLDTRSRSLRSRAGFSQFFLLNNISYIRREVLSSAIGDLLGETVEDMLNKRMRGLKIAYLELWSPLVSSLLDSGLDTSGAAGAIKAAVKGGGEKRETKDRFVRFGDALEDVEALHKVVRWDGDEELKERLRDDVRRMIVPTYSKFVAKNSRGEFSKNASKYLKLDAEQLNLRIDSLFE